MGLMADDTQSLTRTEDKRQKEREQEEGKETERVKIAARERESEIEELASVERNTLNFIWQTILICIWNTHTHARSCTCMHEPVRITLIGFVFEVGWKAAPLRLRLSALTFAKCQREREREREKLLLPRPRPLLLAYSTYFSTQNCQCIVSFNAT